MKTFQEIDVDSELCTKRLLEKYKTYSKEEVLNYLVFQVFNRIESHPDLYETFLRIWSNEKRADHASALT